MSKKIEFSKKIPPWVHGFKLRLVEKHGSEAWCELLGRTILGQYEDIYHGDNTSKSEGAYGIQPAWYSYIARADIRYCYGVFLALVETSGWEASNGGVCPFDTGGLMERRKGKCIKTSYSRLTQKRRINLFIEHNKELNEWNKIIFKSVNSSYKSWNDYVEGVPPKKSFVPEILIDTKINSSPSWTWEGRISKNIVNGKVHLVKLFSPSQEYVFLHKWLPSKHCVFNDREKNDIQDWLNLNCVVFNDQSSLYSFCKEQLIGIYS